MTVGIVNMMTATTAAGRSNAAPAPASDPTHKKE
jgi:hypothetical protein